MDPAHISIFPVSAFILFLSFLPDGYNGCRLRISFPGDPGRNFLSRAGTHPIPAGFADGKILASDRADP
jgi:hypothetical protein